MATVRLYDDDPYLERFSGAVVGFRGGGVVLNRTAFYAEAGGQAGDTGWLGGVRVVDTKVGDGGDIVHIMEEPPGFKVGDAVDGLIDWGRRCRIMRLHTASHIMEYFLWEHFGYMERTGSYVDERKDRADYVHEGRGMRHWSCGPVEMLCAGTHVRNTREVGTVRLRRRNPGRGVERVETSLAE